MWIKCWCAVQSPLTPKSHPRTCKIFHLHFEDWKSMAASDWIHKSESCKKADTWTDSTHIPTMAGYHVLSAFAMSIHGWSSEPSASLQGVQFATPSDPIHFMEGIWSHLCQIPVLPAFLAQWFPSFNLWNAGFQSQHGWLVAPITRGFNTTYLFTT